MFPRWLSWLVLGGLGYLLILGHSHTPQTPLAPVVPAVSTLAATTPTANETATPAPTHSALNDTLDLEHWKRAINPGYAEQHQCGLDTVAKSDTLPAKLIEDTPGNGPAAECGDSIDLALTVWDSHGTSAYHTDSITLALGSRTVAQGLDAGLVGIKPGGTRLLLLPPAALTHAKKSDAPKALLKALGQDRLVVVQVTRLSSTAEAPTP